MTGELSNQRCDRCSIDRKGCSRQISGCQRCKDKGIKCEYLRPIKKNKKYQLFNSSIQIFKVDSSRRNVEGASLKLLKSLDYGKLKIPGYAIKCLVNKFRLRSIYNAMAVLFGGTVFNKPLDLDIYKLLYSQFISILEMENKIKKLVPIINYCELNWFDGYESIMNEAVECYFKYLNIISPLFLQSSFNPKNRSPILMAAIYASGITFMPKTEKTMNLNSYCYYILFRVLKTIYYNPTLESLQIITVVFQGLRCERSLCELIETRFESLAHTSYQLGLHLFTKRIKNDELTLERKLCFCTLVYISLTRLVCYNSPSAFHYYLYNENIELLSDAMKLTNNSTDLCSMLVTEYNYHQSFIYFDFNENKESYEDTYKSSEKYALLNLDKLKSQTESIYIKFLKLKKDRIINSKYDFLIMDNMKSNFHTYYLLINRYLLLRVQSSDTSLQKDQREDIYMKSIEVKACSMIKHIINMAYDSRMYLHYGMLCFALSFLMIHVDNPSENTTNIIQNALTIMDETEKISYIASNTPPIKTMVYKIMDLKKQIK